LAMVAANAEVLRLRYKIRPEGATWASQYARHK